MPAASLPAGEYEVMVLGQSGPRVEELAFVPLRIAAP
jgi:hypothetical protein